MRPIKPWLLAARPKTLGAAVAPVIVGSALGSKLGGGFCIWLALATLGSCVCLQIATNLFNDALDGMKGSDTTDRLGPVRITASGMMSAPTVMKAAVVALALATLLAVPLFIHRGWPIVAIGIPSLWFCYGYTGGPMPLAYRGLGELFVVLFFGLVAVSGSAFVQSGHWYFPAVIAGLQIGMLSTVLIAINNLRDIEEDTKTGKRTLAVRFGKGFARWEISLLMAAAYLLQIYWVLDHPANGFKGRGGSLVGLLPWLLAPIGLILVRSIWRNEPSRTLNRDLALAGGHLIGFSVLMGFALLLS